MIISSWNVNSVRARIENIKSYLLKYKPDVVMMQEIKTEDVNFPYDALFRLKIRKKLREMINLGFNDVYRHFNETKEGYTFWDYMRGAWQKNNGMRIDHFLVSNSLIDQVKAININKDPRGREKPSDHTPIEITLA